MRVADTVAVVTGGGSGLGAAVVRMLVEGGARVGVVDLPAAATNHESFGDTVRYFGADVTDPDQARAAVDGVVEAFGRIDLLVSCAGVAPSHRVVASDGTPFELDVFRRTLEVNLIGLFDVLRWSASHMARNAPGEDGERGLIVNIGSIAGLEGQVGQAAYTASKGAVAALTIQLARDLARNGIRVMTIAPGNMDTPMLAGVPDDFRERLVSTHIFPDRLGRPEELAALVRTFMEVTFLNGEVVRLDAGARLPPA
jgi:3-hydroxyacyl-CoA dehydrogenase/3-hydroxy-2-methylbutyryl-CoA dehydrogenase